MNPMSSAVTIFLNVFPIGLFLIYLAGIILVFYDLILLGMWLTKQVKKK